MEIHRIHVKLRNVSCLNNWSMQISAWTTHTRIAHAPHTHALVSLVKSCRRASMAWQVLHCERLSGDSRTTGNLCSLCDISEHVPTSVTLLHNHLVKSFEVNSMQGGALVFWRSLMFSVWKLASSTVKTICFDGDGELRSYIAAALQWSKQNTDTHIHTTHTTPETHVHTTHTTPETHVHTTHTQRHTDTDTYTYRHTWRCHLLPPARRIITTDLHSSFIQ